MRSKRTRSGSRAMTLFEVLLVVAILIFLAVLVLPGIGHRRPNQRIYCESQLLQIGLAYRVWESDNHGKYPPLVSVTNGGTMELIASDPQFVRDTFLVTSNELGTPKIVHCPLDTRGIMATNFSPSFTSSNISYFIGVEATDSQPQMILSGDDNLSINGINLKSGIHDLSTNAAIAWTKDRHHDCGNIGLADGSAQQLTISGLQQAMVQTGFPTNRFAIR